MAIELLTGLALAATAGLRTCLPLFALSLMARMGLVTLNPAMHPLQSHAALVVFGVAAVIEALADKIPGADHLLDVAGTFVRPAAGTLLASALLAHQDPAVALALGIIVGGGSAFTVHTAKAVTRLHSTALAPLHLGTGNVALSVAEDVVAVGGVGLVAWHPVAAGLLALVLVLCAAVVIVLAVRKAGGWVRGLRAKRAGSAV